MPTLPHRRIQPPQNFGFVEAGKLAEVAHRDQSPGGLAGGLAGAADQALGGVVAAAGELSHVFGIDADAQHGVSGRKRG